MTRPQIASLPRIVAIGLLSLAVLATAAVAASPAAPTASVTETLDVRVVNVEAVVTDKQGIRIPGLKPDQFRLYVDGEEVDIEFFSEVRGGMIIDPETAHQDIATVSPVQAEGTSYLVFIDDFFTIGADRATVLDALQSELGFLGPKDRMAVVAWDGRSIDMLSSWTSSERELYKAFREAHARPAFGIHRISEERQFQFASSGIPYRRTGFGRQLDVAQRTYVSVLLGQLDRLVSATTSTLRSFASPPGRKVMLMVSGGWPYAPVEFAAGNPFDPVLEYRYERGESIYMEMVDTANLLGYTLYPVDAPGLESGASDIDASVGYQPSNRFISRDFYREWDQHTTLRYLAEETGGKALVNAGRNNPLQRVYEDTRSFYWLGFTPQREGDAQYKSIELEILEPGLKLRSRTGFTDLSVEQEVNMAVESALLFGGPAGRDGLDVELGVPRKLKWGKVDLPVQVQIPVDEIALLPVGRDEYVAQLEIRFAALDRHGNRSDIPTIPLEVRRDELPGKGDWIEYETVLKMRDRYHDLVVAVYDAATGQLLSSSVQVVL